ncbi:MAG: endonuclease domain-containing protein [Anaerolineae bacterium]|nr:endonuclease domain-containing protein [Anaerolineae bacterium]
MHEIAQRIRKIPTRSEDLLWESLRGRKMDGYKFRYQQPIGAYIVNFYCADAKLAVEVDGGYHIDEVQEKLDQERQEILESLGIHFIRVTADEVEKSLGSVLTKIRDSLTT